MLVTLRIRAAEGQFAKHCQQRVLRRLLILGFDADIINPVGGIGKDNRLGAAAAQGLGGGLNHRRVQVRQTVAIGDGRRRHVEVNVRLRAGGELRGGLKDPLARHRQVGRQESEKGGIRIEGVVGNRIEMPLVGHPQGEHPVRLGRQQNAVGPQQRSVGPDALVEHEAPGKARRIGELVRDDGHQRLRLVNDRGVGQRQRVGWIAVATGDHQRIILGHVVGVRRHGIHVDPVAHDRDRIVGAEPAFQGQGRR